MEIKDALSLLRYRNRHPEKRRRLDPADPFPGDAGATSDTGLTGENGDGISH